jgi:hypothetical protein
MGKTIAIATTAAFLFTLGFDRSSSATTSRPSDGKVLSEKHYSDHGLDVTVVVTRVHDGVVISRAHADDPTNEDTAEIWTDGRTIKWTGTIGGKPVNGSSAASDLLNLDETESPACLSPVAALICLGAAAALLAGCAFGFSCEGVDPEGGSNPPEGGGGVPGGGEGEPEPEEEPED